MDSVAIGKRLKELRAGKTIMEIAHSLNTSQSSVSMWENGERIPRDEMKVKIAKLYSKKVEDIFFT